MQIIKEQTYKGQRIQHVRDIWNQEWAIIPDLHPNIGYASISDAKREINGKTRKWSYNVIDLS